MCFRLSSCFFISAIESKTLILVFILVILQAVVLLATLTRTSHTTRHTSSRSGVDRIHSH